jgi:hypothetical protein
LSQFFFFLSLQFPSFCTSSHFSIHFVSLSLYLHRFPPPTPTTNESFKIRFHFFAEKKLKNLKGKKKQANGISNGNYNKRHF